jgi:hypothetical protein
LVQVNDEDNVKQDMSIDVYGRKGEWEGESAWPQETNSHGPLGTGGA